MAAKSRSLMAGGIRLLQIASSRRFSTELIFNSSKKMELGDKVGESKEKEKKEYRDFREFLPTQPQSKPPPPGRAKTPVGKLEEIKTGLHPYAEKSPLLPWPDGVNPHTGEIGGPKGPEPTRYGDWERKGRVSDF